MAKFTTGDNAIDDLLKDNSGGSDAYGFAKYPIKVRFLSVKDQLMKYRAYGAYNEVDTFVADNPSVYNAKGYPQKNLTPWDIVSEAYSQRAFDAEEAGASKDEVKELRDLAYKYRGKERYMFGAIDLATGEPVLIDLTKNQAQIVYTAVKKAEAKLGKKAFEIEKTGSGKNTVVTCTALDLDDLTEKEAEAFEKAASAEISASEMYEALYEADAKEQIELLKQTKIDPAEFGLTVPEEQGEEKPSEGLEINDEDLPF